MTMDLERTVDDLMRQPPTRDAILSALHMVWNARGRADAGAKVTQTLKGVSGGGVSVER
jgi:hypothetical protein